MFTTLEPFVSIFISLNEFQEKHHKQSQYSSGVWSRNKLSRPTRPATDTHWKKVMLVGHLRSAEEAGCYQTLSERTWNDWPSPWLTRHSYRGVRWCKQQQMISTVCFGTCDPGFWDKRRLCIVWILCGWRFYSMRAVGGVEAVMWCVCDSLS